MSPFRFQRAWVPACIAALLLALPALGVHAWMASTFPSYLHGRFWQDVVFALAWCGLLVLIVRLRVLRLASIPLALLAYLAWLFLVFGEGISYYLQADTFNARFFANLKPDNLLTGLHAFPVMIGGSFALFALMVVVCIAVLVWTARRGRTSGASIRSGMSVAMVAILAVIAFGVDSSPRRFVGYFTHVQQSAHFADTPQGRAVARLLNPHPVPKRDIIAAPGKNLVWIYMESLERTYWDPDIFPGLTPNLDHLRKQGLDFSGFETFAGANYTIAGMFASQCGAPMFTSAFEGLDMVAGNTTDAATFHPSVTCFGDVLDKAGYTQVYIGGAPIVFSNKGLFFRLHGYDQALGLRQLEAQHGGKLPEEGWGLYDSALFKLALERYRKLESGDKPFNLTLLTLDTHPPHGRPSPGCPTYKANPNSMLQAVHCTDYLLGQFIDALSKEPGWDNTVVVIMSDHLMMRNDAQPLYPEDYHRQPALLVLNAGEGERPVRLYHMDIAPTVLDLMGVRTNATFIAGADRSAPGADGSKLADNAVTDAVLRKALWSHVSEFRLCRADTAVRWTAGGGFNVGGREIGMSYLGRDQIGIRSGQVLDFFIGNSNVKLVITDADRQARLFKSRGDASVLTIRPLPPQERAADLFSVDWLGRGGARAHLADIPRLQGLAITAPHCGQLLAQVDAAPSGKTFDLADKFSATTATPPTLPVAPKAADFGKPGSIGFERGFGWSPPAAGWGSLAIGDEATLGFRLPDALCDGATLRMRVDPYLPVSRPHLDTQVWINGKLATTWHFAAPPVAERNTTEVPDDTQVLQVQAPVDTAGTCQVRVDLRFSRAHASPPPYPKGEDARPLQLRLLTMQATSAAASKYQTNGG